MGKLMMVAVFALGCALAMGEEPTHKAWNAQEESTDNKYADRLKGGMTRAERIAWVKGLLAVENARVKSTQDELALARKAKEPERLKTAEKNEAHLLARRAYRQLEIDWLEGRIAAKTAEAKVKTAEEAVKKAEDAKADEKTVAPLKAALEAAKKELAAVKAWEEKETAKKDF